MTVQPGAPSRFRQQHHPRGVALPGNNRADRSYTTTDTPQNLNIYGVDKLPFGKGHIGGDNFLVRTLLGGWALSGIFTYHSGTPLA